MATASRRALANSLAQNRRRSSVSARWKSQGFWEDEVSGVESVMSESRWTATSRATESAARNGFSPLTLPWRHAMLAACHNALLTSQNTGTASARTRMPA